jgi:predicted nuclease of predicted toxin-antitoxin system
LKFLIDNALSPTVSKRLAQDGHDCVHVREYGLQSAADEVIFERAAAEDRILVSGDTDFGTLLADSGWPGPSVVLFRRTSGNPSIEFGSLSTCLRLDEVREALQRGSIVVIEPSRVRIRALPIGGGTE